MPTGRARSTQGDSPSTTGWSTRCSAAGIEPLPTLYHWDLPQALEDDGGWLGREIAYRFAEYADAGGRALGDRVHRWITVNEPFVHMSFGYAQEEMAPGNG